MFLKFVVNVHIRLSIAARYAWVYLAEPRVIAGYLQHPRHISLPFFDMEGSNTAVVTLKLGHRDISMCCGCKLRKSANISTLTNGPPGVKPSYIRVFASFCRGL